MENNPNLKWEVLCSLAEITLVVLHPLELRHLKNYLWHKRPLGFDLDVWMDLQVHILLCSLFY